MENFGVWVVRGMGGACGKGVAVMVDSYERLVYWTGEFLNAGAVPTYELLKKEDC